MRSFLVAYAITAFGFSAFFADEAVRSEFTATVEPATSVSDLFWTGITIFGSILLLTIVVQIGLLLAWEALGSIRRFAESLPH